MFISGYYTVRCTRYNEGRSIIHADHLCSDEGRRRVRTGRPGCATSSAGPEALRARIRLIRARICPFGVGIEQFRPKSTTVGSIASDAPGRAANPLGTDVSCEHSVPLHKDLTRYLLEAFRRVLARKNIVTKLTSRWRPPRLSIIGSHGYQREQLLRLLGPTARAPRIQAPPWLKDHRRGATTQMWKPSRALRARICPSMRSRTRECTLARKRLVVAPKSIERFLPDNTLFRRHRAQTRGLHGLLKRAAAPRSAAEGTVVVAEGRPPAKDGPERRSSLLPPPAVPPASCCAHVGRRPRSIHHMRRTQPWRARRLSSR